MTAVSVVSPFPTAAIIKVYHARALQAACYALGIRLIHRTVGDLPPGGLIERFFETAQSQFEAEVYAGEILTLQRLNRALSAKKDRPWSA